MNPSLEQNFLNRAAVLDVSLSNFSDNPIKRRRDFHVGLETPRNELYALVHPCLVEQIVSSMWPLLSWTNVVLGNHWLMWSAPLILSHNKVKFRVMRITRLVIIRGADVSFAIREIIRELSDIAVVVSFTPSSDDTRYLIGSCGSITSHFAAQGSILEKRAKSRAEGTSKSIFLNPYPTYEKLLEILLSKISGGEGSIDDDNGGTARWITRGCVQYY
mmetsp:Transcript_28156/g.50975  ORF Transcript_28156/g.50975 Transcript_28156/m.50975 type:complete len:217 (+) Transcript_28156:278-928(+)